MWFTKWHYCKMRWSHFFIREVFPTPEAPSTSTLRTWFHQIFRFPDRMFRFPYQIFRFPYQIFRFPDTIFRFPDQIFRFPEQIFRFPDKLTASAFFFFRGKLFDLDLELQFDKKIKKLFHLLYDFRNDFYHNFFIFLIRIILHRP